MEYFVKALVLVKILLLRIMRESPVCDAKLLESTSGLFPSENLKLVQLEIFPAYRQVVFKSIRARGCLIYLAEINNRGGIICFSPNRSIGGIPEAPFKKTLPPNVNAPSPLKIFFFIEPKDKAANLVTITVKSAQFFMSTSCELYIR